jgi:hypothetical protein
MPLTVATNNLHYNKAKDVKRTMVSKSVSVEDTVKDPIISGTQPAPNKPQPNSIATTITDNAINATQTNNNIINNNNRISNSFWNNFTQSIQQFRFSASGTQRQSARATKIWEDPEQIVGTDPGFVARIVRYLVDGRDVMRLRAVSRVWKFALEGLVGTQEIRVTFHLNVNSEGSEPGKKGTKVVAQEDQVKLLMTDVYNIEPGVQAIVFTPSARQSPLKTPLNSDTLAGISVTLPTCLKAKLKSTTPRKPPRPKNDPDRIDVVDGIDDDDDDEEVGLQPEEPLDSSKPPLMANVSYADGYISFKFNVHNPEHSWLHRGQPLYDPFGDNYSIHSGSGYSTPLFSPTPPDASWSLRESAANLPKNSTTAAATTTTTADEASKKLETLFSPSGTLPLSQSTRLPKQSICLGTRFILKLDPTSTRIVSLILPGTSPITYHIEQLKRTAIDRADGNNPTCMAASAGLLSPDYLKPYILFPAPPLHFYSRLYSLKRWHALRTLMTMTEASNKNGCVLEAIKESEEIQVEGGLMIKCPTSPIVRQLLSCEPSDIPRAFYPLFMACALGQARWMNEEEENVVGEDTNEKPESSAKLKRQNSIRLHNEYMAEYRTISRLVKSFIKIQNRVDILLKMGEWTQLQLTEIEKLAAEHHIPLRGSPANPLLNMAFEGLGDDHPLPALMMSMTNLASSFSNPRVLTHAGKPVTTAIGNGLSLSTLALNDHPSKSPIGPPTPAGEMTTLFSVPNSPADSVSSQGLTIAASTHRGSATSFQLSHQRRESMQTDNTYAEKTPSPAESTTTTPTLASSSPGVSPITAPAASSNGRLEQFNSTLMPPNSSQYHQTTSPTSASRNANSALTPPATPQVLQTTQMPSPSIQIQRSPPRSPTPMSTTTPTASAPQPVTPQLLQDLYYFHTEQKRLQQHHLTLYCSQAAHTLFSLPGGEAFARITGFNGKIGKLGELTSLHIVPVNASAAPQSKKRGHHHHHHQLYSKNGNQHLHHHHHHHHHHHPHSQIHLNKHGHQPTHQSYPSVPAIVLSHKSADLAMKQNQPAQPQISYSKSEPSLEDLSSSTTTRTTTAATIAPTTTEAQPQPQSEPIPEVPTSTSSSSSSNPVTSYFQNAKFSPSLLRKTKNIQGSLQTIFSSTSSLFGSSNGLNQKSSTSPPPPHTPQTTTKTKTTSQPPQLQLQTHSSHPHNHHHHHHTKDSKHHHEHQQHSHHHHHHHQNQYHYHHQAPPQTQKSTTPNPLLPTDPAPFANFWEDHSLVMTAEEQYKYKVSRNLKRVASASSPSHHHFPNSIKKSADKLNDEGDEDEWEDHNLVKSLGEDALHLFDHVGKYIMDVLVEEGWEGGYVDW